MSSFCRPSSSRIGALFHLQTAPSRFLDLFEEHCRPILELHERQCSDMPAEVWHTHATRRRTKERPFAASVRLNHYWARAYLSDEGLKSHRPRDLWPYIHQRNALSVHRIPLFTIRRLILHLVSDPSKRSFSSSPVVENIARLVHLFPRLQSLQVYFWIDPPGDHFNVPVISIEFLKLTKLSFASCILIGFKDDARSLFVWHKTSAYFEPLLTVSYFPSNTVWEFYAGGFGK